MTRRSSSPWLSEGARAFGSFGAAYQRLGDVEVEPRERVTLTATLRSERNVPENEEVDTSVLRLEWSTSNQPAYKTAAALANWVGRGLALGDGAASDEAAIAGEVT
jgi:hypothetical protein